MDEIVKLDGENLTIEQLARVARNPDISITCDESAKEKLKAAEDLVKGIVKDYKDKFDERKQLKDPNDPPIRDYGINTGFGEFKRIPIDPEKLRPLQVNILLSHAAGVGETLDENDLSNYYPWDIVRAVLVLRINAFLKGHSGIRGEIVDLIVKMVNARVIPLVPLRGSVGSSGDLAPLAHLFLWLCKEGRNAKASQFYELVYQPGKDGEVGGYVPGLLMPATELERKLDINSEPELTAKEGLAVTNGATFSAAMLALVVHDAKSLALTADVAAAMSAEALLGCARAFDPEVQASRKQAGQIESAEYMRAFLGGSKLLERADEVQDPYSIRCAPAVHGASRDALKFAEGIAVNEINAATDNPLFFIGKESWDEEFSTNWNSRRAKRRSFIESRTRYFGKKRHSYSAGNFHGQPLALAADFLAIALAEFANISERRTQLLMDKDHNRGLPPNLIPNAGLNSGFMIAQYCAAGLVSENKVLAHPASVDSVPTSSNSEDHNSMATIAARKLRTILANTRHTLAIELLVATQALEWATLYEDLYEEVVHPGNPRDHADLRKQYVDFLRADHQREGDQPEETTEWSNLWKKGDIEKELFEKWTHDDNRRNIQMWLGRGTGEAYKAVRGLVKPMIVDRVLSKDIFTVAKDLLAPEANELAVLPRSVEKFTLRN